MLYAASHKLFETTPLARVREAAAQYVEYVDGNYSAVLSEIKKSGLISDEAKKMLNQAMGEFRLAHKELFA